jgi:uncharacterized protein
LEDEADERRSAVAVPAPAAAGARCNSGARLRPLPAGALVRLHACRSHEGADRNLGAPHEDVAFTTSDGLELRGWYVPSRNGAAVVAFPGRKGPQRQARMLVRHGYGVLLFDRRGEGASDGDPNAFGWAMDRDLKAAAAFLQRRPDVEPDRIGGIGLSVGGEMLVQTAAESTAFKAVVSEGAGARSVRENLEKPRTLGRLSELGVSFVLTAGTAIFSNHAPPPNLKHLSAHITPRSVFFIYALHGTGGEEKELNPKYYAAAGEPKQIWEIPEASHTGGITARPRGVRAASGRLLRQRAARPIGSARPATSPAREQSIRGGVNPTGGTTVFR